MTIDDRLRELGIELPEPFPPPATTSPPCAPATLLYTSGMGPVRADGSIVTGKVGADLDLAAAVEAARLTGLQLLAAVRAELGSLDARAAGREDVRHGQRGARLQPHAAGDRRVLEPARRRVRRRRPRCSLGRRQAELPFDIAVEIELVLEVVADR